MEPIGTGWCCWTDPKTPKNGTLQVFKPDQNIKKIFKEWYSQSLQHKQDFHIILQLLCLHFFWGKMREKHEIKHFSSQSLVPPFYRHVSVCRTLEMGFHFLEIGYDLVVQALHSLELGVLFYRCPTSSPPPSTKESWHPPFYLIQRGMKKSCLTPPKREKERSQGFSICCWISDPASSL